MKQRFRTKTEKVYRNIQEEIVKGILSPGERLKISQLADQFDVSEIPVREALQRLSLEGYVKFIPHVGAIVSSLSEEEIREIFELRIQLEGFATRLAVDNLTNVHLKTLEEIIDHSKDILTVTENQFEDYAKCNRQFHEYIYRHCNNGRLYKIIFDLWDNSRRYPQIFHTTEALHQSIKEHTEILEVLKRRDGDLAEKLTKKHKHKAYELLLNMVKELETENH